MTKYEEESDQTMNHEADQTAEEAHSFEFIMRKCVMAAESYVNSGADAATNHGMSDSCCPSLRKKFKRIWFFGDFLQF